ncbi:hypothetical protein GCM10011579_084520 [Streptomyces albiflavescens]|uniref:Uncharacterized protein n=1 Tax=Streptomyces albiflavescens TaxID=1623582 RepID=A0A917YEF0_9ACTN|nr:hypothetical protein [Streptomyces albiflavescens]GGN89535.1 hypothetical protein GCM10011579_084520 [Streptomyces albiflavescens]
MAHGLLPRTPGPRLRPTGEKDRREPGKQSEQSKDRRRASFNPGSKTLPVKTIRQTAGTTPAE